MGKRRKGRQRGAVRAAPKSLIVDRRRRRSVDSEGHARTTRNWAAIRQSVLPPLIVVLVALAAFANAWPDNFVLDDKFFENPERFAAWSNIPRYFAENVWASQGLATPLYRPLLLTSITMDTHLYGGWMAGFHLTNILLHGLVALLVFSFLRQLLSASGVPSSTARLCAVLAALVFAVHPAQTEAVNSVFNRSEIMAAAAGLAGLNGLLKYRLVRPVMAWSGLAIGYFVALFCKESIVALPVLAAILVFVLASGNTWARFKSCLPAIALAVPLAIYLVLRFHALEPAAGGADLQAAAEVGRHAATAAPQVPDASEGNRWLAVIPALEGLGFPTWKLSLRVAGFFHQGLGTLLWPFSLQVIYKSLPVTGQYQGLAVHLLLLGTALFLARKKHFGLLLALSFFYLAMLPASGIVGEKWASPVFALRYLYFAAVGLAIALAFGLAALVRRFDILAATAMTMVVLIVFSSVTWARNAAWSDEVRLLGTDYERGNRSTLVLRLLTAAYLMESRYQTVAEVCDENADVRNGSGELSLHCGIAYRQLGRDEEAVNAYLAATRRPVSRTVAHDSLGKYYLGHGQRGEAEKHLSLAVETENDPAMRAFRRGYMLVRLYPRNRERLLEARAAFVEALERQPSLPTAQTWLSRVDRLLEKS